MTLQLPISGAHTEEAFCYLSLELSFASSLKLIIYLQLDVQLKYKQFQHMHDFYCQGSQQQWPRIHATFNARAQNFFTHSYLLNCKSLALLIKPHFLTQACKHSLPGLYVRFCSLTIHAIQHLMLACNVNPSTLQFKPF